MADNLLNVEVAYATEHHQVVLKLQTSDQSTILEAIQASGLLIQFPEIDLNTQKIGVFGQVVSANQTVRMGDRIEIYRPLKIDPMDARRQKARTT